MEREGGFAGRARNRCKCPRHGKEQHMHAEWFVQQVWGKLLGQGVVSVNPRGSAEISAKDLMSCAQWWAVP